MLWNLLVSCFKDLKCGPLFCIIDAIDELNGSLFVLQWIVQQFEQGLEYVDSCPIKFLMTGRPEMAIRDIMSGIPNIQLRIEDNTGVVNQDIIRVIKSRVARLSDRCRPATLVWLENQLINGSDRTFLWVQMVLRRLEESPTSSQNGFESLVRNLPRSLQEVYRMILAKIAREDRADAIHLFSIILAARRPLFVDEIETAFIVRTHHTSLTELQKCKGLDFVRTLYGFCGQFIRIMEGKRVFFVRLHWPSAY
jgi:hypothetical protein